MATRSSGLLCGAFVVLAAGALEAGGWAVVTVKELPDYAIVGKPVTVTYAVRQHGRHLLNGLDGRLEMRLGAHVFYKAAMATSESGHYSATFTLPYAGDWTIDVLSGFAGEMGSSRVVIHAIARGAQTPTVSEAERGRRLFNGKGCVTCHTHGSVGNSRVPVGPELTARRYQPEPLQEFLAHPTQTPSAKFGELMPDLDLRDAEIASLIAFINGQ